MTASRSFSVSVAMLVLLVAAATGVAATARPAAVEFDLKSGRLTLKSRGAPLSEIVQRIGERVGFETILVGDLDTPVNASFTNMPVLPILNELLRDADRVLVYAPRDEDAKDRVIVKLWVFEASQAMVGPAVVNSPRQAALDDDLQDDFQQGDAKTRSEAVLMLANAGANEQVLGALIEALQGDEDALVRTRAATALGKLGDERSVPALELALSDEHGTVRTQAIHALGQIDSQYATMVLGNVLLQSIDTSERVVAAWGLSRQDTPLAHEYLDMVADDPDEQVRAASKKRTDGTRPKTIDMPARRDRLGAESTR